MQRWTSLCFRMGFALLVVLPALHLLLLGPAADGAAWPAALDAAGVLMAVAGAILALAAQAHMGASWRIGAAAGRLGPLVTDGPFAWSRNPVFVGQIGLLWGLAVAGGEPVTALLALLVTVAAVVQAAVEERLLMASGGEDYHAYRARLPRWIGRPGT